jgi:large subunit ribosomal protein L4
MKCQVTTLDNQAGGEIELSDAVFAAPVRKDILARVVNWQLAKRRAGTHDTKTRSQVKGSTTKIYRQKGTGRARHGAKKAPIFVGGGIAHGPHPRSHAHDLPKKVRRLGLKSALSAKAAEGKLTVLDSARMDSAKTRDAKQKLNALGLRNALIVAGGELDPNFSLAVRNIVGIDVLPQIGANVHDILRHDQLVLTKDAVEALEARLT